MGNISGGELMILIFLALVLVGPDRLPQYAKQLGKLVRTIKEMMSGAKDTLKEELGDDFEELQKFDPRQYDPRRILRDALNDPTPARRQPFPRASSPSVGSDFTATSRAGTVVAGGAALAGAAIASGAGEGIDGDDDAGTGAPGSHEVPVGAPFDDEAT